MITEANHEAEFITRIQWGPRGESVSIYSNYGLKQKLTSTAREAFEGVIVAALRAAKEAEEAAKKAAKEAKAAEQPEEPNVQQANG